MVSSNAPSFTTRNSPACSAMKKRPSGLWANAVVQHMLLTQSSVFVKPCGTARLPPKLTVALAHVETLPELSRARARSTCWPAG